MYLTSVQFNFLPMNTCFFYKKLMKLSFNGRTALKLCKLLATSEMPSNQPHWHRHSCVY